MTPVVLYEANLWARPKWLGAVERLSPEQYVQALPFGRRSVRATLVHIGLAEEVWLARIRGELGAREAAEVIRRLQAGSFGREDPFRFVEEKMPDFPTARAALESQAQEVLATMRGLSEDDWHREIELRGARRSAYYTLEEIFTQIALHEVHHRAQILAMLRLLGVPVENVDFIRSVRRVRG